MVKPEPRARKDQLLVEEVKDELVVYDLKLEKAHLLNPVAAFVWRHCDGETTVAQLVALLRDELEPAANEDVVLLALDELGQNHLLEEARAASTIARSFSRRQLMRRLAVVAAIGLTLPVIESLDPPPAQAAASGCSGGCGFYILFFCIGLGCPDGCTCRRVSKRRCACR